MGGRVVDIVFALVSPKRYFLGATSRQWMEVEIHFTTSIQQCKTCLDGFGRIYRLCRRAYLSILT
jgi:hypothetical protein